MGTSPILTLYLINHSLFPLKSLLDPLLESSFMIDPPLESSFMIDLISDCIFRELDRVGFLDVGHLVPTHAAIAPLD